MSCTKDADHERHKLALPPLQDFSLDSRSTSSPSLEGFEASNALSKCPVFPRPNYATSERSSSSQLLSKATPHMPTSGYGSASEELIGNGLISVNPPRNPEALFVSLFPKVPPCLKFYVEGMEGWHSGKMNKYQPPNFFHGHSENGFAGDQLIQRPGLLLTLSGDRISVLQTPASARGLGVHVVTKWSQISKCANLVVQKYIKNPYLINNSKFDLRIYVFVYSIYPLILYVHEDGLVRFASHEYSNSTRLVGNRFVHLTNYSINRQNSDYKPNSNAEKAAGHKWTLRAFWKYLSDINIDWRPIWSAIKDIIIKTCISVEDHLKNAVETHCISPYNVHELFGFDILLDANLKPWLLEVNVSPSMHIDSLLDSKVKDKVIVDMLNIAGINPPSANDASKVLIKPPSQSPGCGYPQLPPYQHLNITPNSDNLLQHSLQSSEAYQCDNQTSVTSDQSEQETKCESSLPPQNISQGAGPDSGDFESYVKAVEARMLIMKLKKDEKMRSFFNWLGNQNSDAISEDQKVISAPQAQANPDLDFYRHAVSGIMEKLTPADLRCLIQLLDSKNRAGDFQLIFPSAKPEETAKYLNYFRSPRYYNLLNFAYLDKYEKNSQSGIDLLSELCENEVHVKSTFYGDKLDERNVWRAPDVKFEQESQRGDSENASGEDMV
ncbi:hypothetical protein Aperf_G00000075298 [Anoplocephala perfoliata]